jgi:hypothetical protein
LPPSLREFAAVLAAMERGGSLDWIDERPTLRVMAQSEAVVLWAKDEADSWRAIRFADLGRPDPPVSAFSATPPSGEPLRDGRPGPVLSE